MMWILPPQHQHAPPQTHQPISDPNSNGSPPPVVPNLLNRNSLSALSAAAVFRYWAPVSPDDPGGGWNVAAPTKYITFIFCNKSTYIMMKAYLIFTILNPCQWTKNNCRNGIWCIFFPKTRFQTAILPSMTRQSDWIQPTRSLTNTPAINSKKMQ